MTFIRPRPISFQASISSRLVRDHPLQLPVLALQLPKPLRVVGLEATVLLTPTVQRLLRHLQLLADRCHSGGHDSHLRRDGVPRARPPLEPGGPRALGPRRHRAVDPLTTIRSNAGFLIDRPHAGDRDRNEALADIAAEGERMSRLVDDLLTLARADAGRPLELRPVDLAWLVRDVAGTARRGGRPVRLELDGAVVAHGDPEACRRLVAILLDNAVRHGGGEVDVALSSDGGRAVLSVGDRGPGIAEPDLERIFDRFFQADPSRGHEGAGLGLAIARSIAEAHGGSIRAANRVGGGAVLTAKLPLAPAAA